MNQVIITTAGAPHPQALIQSVDLSSGAIAFAWLDAGGNPVDSGNSVAQLDVSSGNWPTLTQIRAALVASTS